MKTYLLPTIILGAAALFVSAPALHASTEAAARAIAIELGGVESDQVAFDDTGYGPNNLGAGNGVFDWNDLNGDGALNVNEPSEPLSFTVTCSEGFVEAIRSASSKYPNLALDIATVIVSFSGEMTDPECLAEIAAAIVDGANLGGDVVSVIAQIFVAGFPEGQETAAAAFYESFLEKIPFLPIDPTEPVSPVEPGPDDVPPSTPVPTPSGFPTPTPAPAGTPAPVGTPAPTPVQPSPTPVTPFQNN